ncbi:MAG: glycosyltransferase, partial [Muribaculum sp.]|nr:glycosyltransferase [Muribaculum sp.]
MKILLVHNDYGKYSGEEAVVDKMAVMLAGLGHEVAQLRMTTAGARESLSGKIRGFISGIYCPSGVKSMREAIKREKPDVVNVHNLYPFISPAALRECKTAGIPVVMTIHNFRLMCPTGLFMRDGKPCELCLEKGNEWGCVKYNCEQSLLKSVGYAARNAVARIRKHYMDCVDHFACITEFQRRKLIQSGFSSERISVIPNAVDAIHVSSGINDIKDRGYVAYSGRISREKGVDMIIACAHKHPEIPFRL